MSLSFRSGLGLMEDVTCSRWESRWGDLPIRLSHLSPQGMPPFFRGLWCPLGAMCLTPSAPPTGEGWWFFCRGNTFFTFHCLLQLRLKSNSWKLLQIFCLENWNSTLGISRKLTWSTFQRSNRAEKITILLLLNVDLLMHAFLHLFCFSNKG